MFYLPQMSKALSLAPIFRFFLFQLKNGHFFVRLYCAWIPNKNLGDFLHVEAMHLLCKSMHTHTKKPRHDCTLILECFYRTWITCAEFWCNYKRMGSIKCIYERQKQKPNANQLSAQSEYNSLWDCLKNIMQMKAPCKWMQEIVGASWRGA